MTCERVLVLYNEPILPEDHPDYISEVDILDNVEAVTTTLSEAGYQVGSLGVPDSAEALLQGIRAQSPDVIINLFEGTGNNNAAELYAAGLLEWLGIPYTGCPFHSLVLARSKHVAKRLFQSEGLPTAPFLVIEKGPVKECSLQFPLIVKPATQDASIGVDQESVVTDLESLNRRIQYSLDQFGGPILVEEFIYGRELTVALVEMPDLRFLPGTEVVFPEETEGYWPILSYDAKWTMDSSEFQTTDYHFHAEMTPELSAKIQDYACRAFRLMGARDCARVDFRIRKGDDQPFILELNPNPSFAPDRALANNLWAAGISHADFTLQMVRNALERGRSKSTSRYQVLREAS